MEIGVVKAEPRKPGNRNAAQRLRREGMIPAIIYGHGENPEMFAISRHDLEICLSHKAHVVKLKIGEQEQQFLLKDVQYDHLEKTPIHADLMRVRADERVKVNVPIELRGAHKGAGAGAVLVQILTDLHVECLIVAIPDAIKANVAHMDIGSQLKVGELELPANVKALHNANELVAVVRMAHVAEAPVAAVPAEGEAAEPAEPEVIGRVAKEKPAEEAAEK